MPSIVEVELEDPWGEKEHHSATHAGDWKVQLTPDRPDVSFIKFRFLRVSSATKTLDFSLQLNACYSGLSTNKPLPV